MKSKLSLLLLFLSVAANATIITVSKNASMAAQYNNLQTAVNAAAAHDTIYLYAVPIRNMAPYYDYDSCTLTKPLTLIGEGAIKPGTASGSLITYLTINSPGCHIYGCAIRAQLNLYSSDIVVYGCSVNRLEIAGNNIAIEYCNVSDMGISNHSIAKSNIVVRNNIISVLNFPVADGSSILIINNKILLIIGKHMDFSNNIIKDISNGGLTNCILTNNLLIGAYDYSFLSEYSNEVSGNVVSQNPGFVRYNLLTTLDNPLFFILNPYQNTEFLTDPSLFGDSYYDFHLVSGSPGKNMGTDGRDVGIYGGAQPFIEGDHSAGELYRYFPTAGIPRINEMTIAAPSVAQDGTLTVKLKAKKQN